MDTFAPAQPDSLLPAGAPLLSIAEVERETGLGKDTLRAWERRYGFPVPERDGAGVRGYPRPLVDRLRLIRRALLAGQRPGRLLGLPPRELDAILARLTPAVASAAAPGAAPAAAPAPAALAEPAGATPSATMPDPPGALVFADALAAMRAGGAEALRHWLTRGLARAGLGRFVTEGLAPLTAAVGQAWLDGTMAVYEEHLYSEAVQSVLRNGLLPFQAGLAASAPRILLTTLPGEAHGLGLLMAEALMTLDACRCLSLGVQTPLADIVAASAAHRIDIVALSFTESLPAAHALAGLAELRARLPAHVAIWAGGSAPVLRGTGLAGIRAMTRLEDIPGAVADWRAGAAARQASNPTAV